MDKSKVLIFIDDNVTPIAELPTPVQFEIDSRKLIDGEHTLKIVSKSPTGREGIKFVKFFVRNGPAITIEGIKDNEVIDGTIPLLVNAYDKGHQKEFIIDGSETPHSVPYWIWILLITFFGWALFYCIRYFSL